MQIRSFRARTIPALFLIAAACAAPRVAPAPQPGTAAPPPGAAAPPPVAVPAPAGPENAAALGASPLDFADLPGWGANDFDASLGAFRKSCAAVARRTDASGLTQPSDWSAACTLVAAGATNARSFFETHFVPVKVGPGTAFVTGYYEPEIAGSRTRSPDYLVPVYGLPDDLVRVDQPDPATPGQMKKMTGRIDETGQFQLYWDRKDIDHGALIDRNLEIAWAADPIEFFFLQIQGSGRLRLPDGSVMRIGYAGQNGREYVGIGRRLREMAALAPGEATMDGIVRWLHANPEAGQELMWENKSYVFFKELTGNGPLGAMGAPVTPERSLAADPKFVPLGAPVWLSTRYTDIDKSVRPFAALMVAQDTGGAIKGANRFDLFWGAGTRARTIAGGLSSPGEAYILLPRAAAARLFGGPAV